MRVKKLEAWLLILMASLAIQLMEQILRQISRNSLLSFNDITSRVRFDNLVDIDYWNRHTQMTKFDKKPNFFDQTLHHTNSSKTHPLFY